MRAIRKRVVWFTGLALLLASCSNTQHHPHEPFFRETGHFVNGEFLDFYNRVPAFELVYGYPITEQFISRDGKTVQYFQRARFELVTDSQGNSTIQLTPIGLALYQPAAPSESKIASACEIFAGFQVCYDFLDFYKANGGVAQFGNPISSAEDQAGLYVQYFEKARFEWRTNGVTPRVEISQLGRSYFDYLAEDRAHLNAVEPQDATINPVLSLDVRAFVSKSVTRANGEQTVSVVVQSQTSQSVSGAKVKLTIHLTDGTTQELTSMTNAEGIANLSFSFANQTAGNLVPIEITVDYQGLPGKTKTSFRIWY